MTRFVKDILDVKNVLGAQRVQPIPSFDPSLIVLRAAINDNVDYTPTFIGTLTVQAKGETATYPDSYSGVQIGVLDMIANEDVLLSGNISNIFLLNSANVSLLAINNTATFFAITRNIKTLDLRNATSITGFVIREDNLNQIYAIANNITQKNISCDMINSSGSIGGILWIDNSQTYADDVIEAARLKGWTVRYL